MPKTTIDFKATYGSNFVLGTVTHIDLIDKYVVVDTLEDVIKYTDLVIAVGTIGPFPSKIFTQKADVAAEKYKNLGDEVQLRLSRTLFIAITSPLAIGLWS